MRAAGLAQVVSKLLERVEVPTGFEPVYTDLQSGA